MRPSRSARQQEAGPVCHQHAGEGGGEWQDLHTRDHEGIDEADSESGRECTPVLMAPTDGAGDDRAFDDDRGGVRNAIGEKV
ncbi:MAG: hypothetical protein JO283_03890 [Bradyrhizobium sp.]|nr:hypothetical protein [Bradyrhizobium sp.]